MSQATTTTTTWTVSKYSRCYVNHAAVTSGDWQHYTTPIIHLLLERTIGNDGSLVAIRLRVMWKMHGSNSASVVGEEVVFESLDLLQFALHPHEAALMDVSTSTRHLPLRAVFSEKSIAFRYMWPSTNEASQSTSGKQYRRFQVTLEDNRAVASLVQSIATICPCEAASASKTSEPQQSKQGNQPFSSTLRGAPSLTIKSAPLPLQDRTPDIVGLNTDVSTTQLNAARPSSRDPLRNNQVSCTNSADLNLQACGPLSELYSLSGAELGNVVARIVREPEFVDFLEKVDRMWQVRSFLDTWPSNA